MTVVGTALAVVGFAFLVLVFFSAAPLAHALGLADERIATITAKELHPRDSTFVRGCDSYRFEVEWEGRTGRFSVCNDPDNVATLLEVGDPVVITAVPWSSEVAAEGIDDDLFWVTAGLLISLVMLRTGVLWVLRYRRLVAGAAYGVELPGRVVKVSAHGLRVALDEPAGRTLVLLPAKRHVSLRVDQQVGVWASRRSRLTRRPAGPWVVGAGGRTAAYTHAWVRRTRNPRPGSSVERV